MDPLPTGSPPERQRFPRPRGDGPPFCKAKLDERAVSPPTRGWTHDRGTDRLREGGFPAHAGMDLRCEMPSARVSWFPRPRGDGPAFHRHDRRDRLVSPPTRGWTLRRRRDGLLVRGFPAHAGMDPHGTQGRALKSRFPRPRGDGPCEAGRSALSAEVSPPTRGWTDARRRDGRHAVGFPAHAGMDPCAISASHRSSGFPRPRGDGPASHLFRLDHLTVSPPTRGWTFAEGAGRCP